MKAQFVCQMCVRQKTVSIAEGLRGWPIWEELRLSGHLVPGFDNGSTKWLEFLQGCGF